MSFLTSFVLATTISCGPDVSGLPVPLGLERPGPPGTERPETTDRVPPDSPLLESDEFDSTIVTPASLSISPSPVSLRPDESARFRVDAFDHNGQPMQVVPVFKATGGTIEQDGTYTAGTGTGVFNVTARVGDLSATAVIVISDTAAPTTLELSPPEALVSPGGTVGFEAVVRDQDGNPMSRPVTWMATGGSISSTGVYTAGGTSGIYMIIASSEGLSSTATLTISPADPAASIVVNPTSVDLQPGENHQFAIDVRDKDGNRMDVPVTWEATGGSITTTGLYSAGNTPGTYSVTAESGDLATTASVTVLSAAALPSQGSIITKATFDRGDFSEWGGPSGDPDYCGKLDRGHVGGDAGVRSEHARSGKYAWKAENDPNLPVGCNPKGSAKILHWAGKTPDDFFISAWYYFPSTYPLELTHGSFMQIKEAHPDSDPIWLPVHGVKNGRHHFWLFAWGGFNPGITQVWGPPVPLDRWFNITMYVKKGYSNGIIRVWIDGTLTWEYKNVNTLGNPTKNTTNDVQWGVQNYTPQFPGLHSWLYIDDVVLYDAQ